MDFFKTPKFYFCRGIVLRYVQPFYLRMFKLSAKGLENIPKERSYLMVANHSHLLDPFFIGSLIRKPFSRWHQMSSSENLSCKLVKLLNVPLITVVSKGNYIAFPRWANKKRKSPITVHYSKPVMFDKKSSDEEIIEHIRKGIYNNDNYTRVEKIKGKNPADGLPRLLWRCPV